MAVDGDQALLQLQSGRARHERGARTHGGFHAKARKLKQNTACRNHGICGGSSSWSWLRAAMSSAWRAIFSAGVEKCSAISSLEFCLRMMRSVIVAAPRCKSICCFAVSCLDESPLFLHVRRLMAVGDGPVTGAADATSSLQPMMRRRLSRGSPRGPTFHLIVRHYLKVFQRSCSVWAVVGSRSWKPKPRPRACHHRSVLCTQLTFPAALLCGDAASSPSAASVSLGSLSPHAAENLEPPIEDDTLACP